MERARSLPAVQCADVTPAEREAQILGVSGLLGVDPLTTTVRRAKHADGTRLAGTVLRYAAPPAVTPAWFQRELECHAADVALGRVPARDDDPYVSPAAWLDFEVATAGSALVITVRAPDSEAAADTIERARRLSSRSRVQ
jgi:hypothetical protein